jgi:hypothetical protein
LYFGINAETKKVNDMAGLYRISASLTIYAIYFVSAFLFVSCDDKTSGITSPGQSDNPIKVESAQESVLRELIDGKYCAEVNYSNDHTGRKSNYSLLIDVKDRKVTCIYWPQGGHLDADHFSPAVIPHDGRSVINTFDGKEYSIVIIGPEATCQERFDGQLHQCKGITKRGSRCKRMTDNESGFCYQHESE